jgi:putative spermidine/putrescine transport system permease protein
MNWSQWQTRFARALTVALAAIAIDLVIRLLGADLSQIGSALADTLRDVVIIAIVAIIAGLLTPYLANVWTATATAREAIVGVGVKVPWPWVIFVIGILYFIGPLLATFNFSLTILRGTYSFQAYANVFQTPTFQQDFSYSLLIGVCAIIVGLLIVVPAAYFVRLRAPHLRPIIEFLTLLPLIVPPIILVFGYIRLYGPTPLLKSGFGTDILLTFAYVALALPYMYRAVDTGLRTIDVQTLTEAANILGANTVTILLRVIFPNIIVAVLSGAFLTLAIVIGEFTMASLLNRPAFGVYMQNVGANRAYEPAALAVISFIITWVAMGMIQLLARFAPKTARS